MSGSQVLYPCPQLVPVRLSEALWEPEDMIVPHTLLPEFGNRCIPVESAHERCFGAYNLGSYVVAVLHTAHRIDVAKYPVGKSDQYNGDIRLACRCEVGALAD